MEIVENPSTKLESVDLIDANGVLLRITLGSLVAMDYSVEPVEIHIDDVCKKETRKTLRYDNPQLRFTVAFSGRLLDFCFEGQEATNVVGALRKLEGY